MLRNMSKEWGVNIRSLLRGCVYVEGSHEAITPKHITCKEQFFSLKQAKDMTISKEWIVLTIHSRREKLSIRMSFLRMKLRDITKN